MPRIVWVAVRGSFACRSCGFQSPLEGIVVADGVDCAQCGSFQRFEKSAWRPGLAFAHAVGDLGGPTPEGRFPSADVWIGDANPHASIGMTGTFAVKESDGLRVEASPGHPVCRKCRVLFDLRPEGAALVAQCPTCAATARFALSPEIAALAPAARAAVSEEQRLGRQEVNVQAMEAGLVAMTCPQCGAAVKPDGQTVACGYCAAHAFVPPRARPRGPGRIVKPIVFWVAFDGPSPERKALETPKAAVIDLKLVKGIFTRGLKPIPGIELAEKRAGTDWKQLLLTASLTTLAMVVGYFIYELTLDL
jgi:Zn finger protein HypA/HybF involved in hydrogenase expression